jgi:hypothetical protein
MTTTRQTAWATAAALALGLAATPRAEAALVTYAFSGVVTSVGFGIPGGPAIESAVTGLFTWDTLAQLTSSISNSGGYANAVRAYQVNFAGGQTLTANSAFVKATRYSGYDAVELLSPSGLTSVFGMTPVNAGLELIYAPDSLFATDAATADGIPTLPNGGLFAIGINVPRGTVTYSINGNFSSVVYSVTSLRFVSSVSSVPTPPTLALVGVALLAAVGLSRRRGRPFGRSALAA